MSPEAPSPRFEESVCGCEPDLPPARCAVFDVGGVLLRWDPNRVYGGLIPDEARRRWFLSEVCSPEWNSTLDAGRPFEEALEELAARHPGLESLIGAWARQDEMIAGEVTGASDLVERLRAAQVPLYLLTNMPADVFAARWDRFELLRRFDGAVVSGQEGVIKPAPEIFQRLLDRFGLKPWECIFIDDAEANVGSASAIGFHVHHFSESRALSGALRRHGLID